MRRKGFTELVDFAQSALGYSLEEAEEYAERRLADRAEDPSQPDDPAQLTIHEPDPHDPRHSAWPRGY